MRTNEFSVVLREEIFNITNPEVSVSTVSGDVQISESSDGKCYVEIRGRSGRAKDLAESVEITSTDRTLSIHVDRNNRRFGGLLGGGSSDLKIDVWVPKKSTLKIKTVSADVKVEPGVLRLDIGSVSGDIAVLHNPLGICNLKTVSGDISTRTFSSCQYTLKSVSGDIKVLVAQGLEVDVDGKTLSGDLSSEISLDSNSETLQESSELVTISTSTVSGDFTLARN
jgi:DUF4097 and DUF4098 domain-containing protein YvlB